LGAKGGDVGAEKGGLKTSTGSEIGDIAKKKNVKPNTQFGVGVTSKEGP